MAKYHNRETGETVNLVDGSFEDTRVGSLAIDGSGGWSKVEDDPAVSSTPDVPAARAPGGTDSDKPATSKKTQEG